MNKRKLKIITLVVLTLCLVGTFVLLLKWLSEFYCHPCDHSPKWIVTWFISTMALFIALKMYGRKI